MADDGDGLAAVAGVQVADSSQDALAHGGEGLADLAARQILFSDLERRRPALIDLVGGQPLPDAQVDLAPAGVRLHRQAQDGADNLGGLLGAQEVAGVERGDAQRVQPLAQLLRLPAALLSQPAGLRRLALDQPLLVPFALAVAAEEEGGGWM